MKLTRLSYARHEHPDHKARVFKTVWKVVIRNSSQAAYRPIICCGWWYSLERFAQLLDQEVSLWTFVIPFVAFSKEVAMQKMMGICHTLFLASDFVLLGWLSNLVSILLYNIHRLWRVTLRLRLYWNRDILPLAGSGGVRVVRLDEKSLYNEEFVLYGLSLNLLTKTSQIWKALFYLYPLQVNRKLSSLWLPWNKWISWI